MKNDYRKISRTLDKSNHWSVMKGIRIQIVILKKLISEQSSSFETLITID